MKKPNIFTPFVLPNGNLFFGCYLTRALFSYMKLHYNSILDVGCGIGTQLEFFRTLGMEKIVGCDISFSAKKACDNKEIEFNIVDLNDKELRLPYSNNSFDVVMCNQVLEHVKYPHLVVREMVRIAKDLACFVVPADHSYESPDHIQHWYSFKDIVSNLLQGDWTFSVEIAISKPLDPILNYAAFIVCIYKNVDSNAATRRPAKEEHYPIFVHVGE